MIWTPLHVEIFPLFDHPPTYVSVPWLCAGICASVSVCVSAPHVLPSVTNVPAFLPTGILPVRSGRLKVVDPSPTP